MVHFGPLRCKLHDQPVDEENTCEPCEKIAEAEERGETVAPEVLTSAPRPAFISEIRTMADVPF